MRAPVLAALALLGAGASAAPPARAAEPKIGDCLIAAENSLKLRSEHKLRQARTQLLVCSASSCPAEVRQECMKRIDEVNAAQPSIVFAVKTPAGKELTAVKVTVDGQALTDHLDGSALAVDPGAHEFTFEAIGEPAVTETLVLHEGEKDRKETVTIGTPAEGPPTSQPVVAPAKGGPAAPESPPEGPAGGSPLRMVGLVVAGVGVAGLGVGAVFGALASSAWQTAQKDCPSHTGCSSKAMDEHSSAVSDATISTVAFIAGGVLAAGGVTLYFVAPKGSAATVGLGATPGGLVVTGKF